jgi:C-terminal processing protease CtpA/Prc
MKILKISLLALIIFSFTSCFDNDIDDNLIAVSEINDFVWKGMNAVYLYKAEIPNLANDRFSSNEEYTEYLNGFSEPEDLFESVIYQRETVDRFSWIVDDFIALEQLFSGVSKSNGLEFNFYFAPGSTTEVFGIIRLVLNNSVADNLNLERGQIFNAVDGTNLTADNLNTLLNQDSYTLNLANYDDNGTPEVDDDTITSSNESVSLTKEQYTENPVHKTEVINIDGENLGYLVYNGFNANFVNELNAVFADFQANNIQHLVLDLRYNPGGRVDVASYLGSMITGQFTGDVFSKLIYNEDLQNLNSTFDFTTNFDGTPINSINLNKVYILTTERSASASELVINSLSAYIDVVQIGDFTTGKTQASFTVYDSPDLGRDGANPNHNYALQPLVANSVNKNNVLVPSNGLTPTIQLIESPINFGILGDINEPLLAAAISDISGTGRLFYNANTDYFAIDNKVDFNPFESEMYIENDLILNRLQFINSN